ncbi:MAG: DNA-binding protein [Deltaproteobacteria bacterium]|nr:DNA-binding protein [Deltaproteobacteria bacterium]
MTTREIEARVASFVADLDALVRKAALEAVQSALGGGATPRTSSPSKKAAAPAAKASSAPRAAKKGGKRDPNALAKLVDAVKAHISLHPGEGVEAISKHMGVSSKEITLPITKLLADKTITRKGQRRGTRYFPAK